MPHDDPFLEAPIRRSGEWCNVAGNLKTEPARREIILVLDYSGLQAERSRGLKLCSDLNRRLAEQGLILEPPDVDPHEGLIRQIVHVPDRLEFGNLFEEIHKFLKESKRSKA